MMPSDVESSRQWPLEQPCLQMQNWVCELLGLPRDGDADKLVCDARLAL